MLQRPRAARKGRASISHNHKSTRGDPFITLGASSSQDRNASGFPYVRNKSLSGQSLVEFALISIILFTLIMGIIEVGRLLFTYSVISNAAQEGSRYGITRPRDVIAGSLATQIAATGTPTYIAQQVAPDGSCNVIDKAREKVWGIDRNEVQVEAWYDIGDSTPVVVSTDPTNPGYFNNVIVKGNRIAVEATYNFHFMVPILDAFAPNGIDVKMRSARTIMSNGDAPSIPCAFNPTPAPTFTVSPTATGTHTETPTPTETDTPTPASTDTPTETPDPSGTPTGTITGSPAATLTPTITQTPSITATPTDTPTETPTPDVPTPIPTNFSSVEGCLVGMESAA